MTNCQEVEGFTLMLLTCIERKDMDLTGLNKLIYALQSIKPSLVRTAAAINFKNLVKKLWDVEGKIKEDDRAKVKMNIVKLMLNTPENIQRQLSEAISIIGRIDFYEKWQQLLPEIIAYIQEGDYVKINGCLRTVHSIFKRYRYEIKVNINRHCSRATTGYSVQRALG